MKKYCKDVVYCIGFKNSNLKHSSFRQESVVDEFHFEKVIQSDKTEVVFVRDPIYEAFNGQRLAQLGRMNIEQWFDSLKQKPLTAIQELRNKCSDDDLLMNIKPRYAQSPAEIAAWADRQAANMSEFESKVAAAMQAQQAAQAQEQAAASSTDNSE